MRLNMEKPESQQMIIRPDWSGYVVFSVMCGFFWIVYFAEFLLRPLSANRWQGLLIISVMWILIVMWIRFHRISIDRSVLVYKRPFQTTEVPINRIKKLEYVFPFSTSHGPTRLLVTYENGDRETSLLINVKLLSRRDIKLLA